MPALPPIREACVALLSGFIRALGWAAARLRVPRRLGAWILGGLFLLASLAAILGTREAYRVFALRHWLRDLAMHSHGLTDEAVLEKARKRALRLGFRGVLAEEDPLEVGSERDEDGFPLRTIRLRLQQPLEARGWVLLAYPLELEVQEVVIAPPPPEELE